MHYTYSSLYHIRGLSPSSPNVDEKIFDDPPQRTRAVLTSDPTPLCTQLDTSPVLANMLLTGLFHGTTEPGTIDERLARQVQRLREERQKKLGAGVFLFVEANGETTDPFTPTTQRDCGDFILALDGPPKRDIRNHHEPVVRKILAAIGLGIPSVAGFEKVADAVVFIDAGGKPIYSFKFDGKADAYVSRRPSAEDLAAARQLASRIVADTSMDRIVRLLNESLEPHQERLRKFLSAWMALEVFVNKNFSAYEKRFWDSLSAGVSLPIRERYLKRIHEVMRDKYKLLEKFVVISSETDPSSADDDIAMFECGKDLRDRFSHGEAIDEAALPLEGIQGLVRRLVRLHIERI
jgi:hypothetical protein